MFETELRYFIDNQEQFVREHAGKVLVLRGENVEGIYLSSLEAYLEAQKRFPTGTFMIQPCESGPGAYTVTLNV